MSQLIAASCAPLTRAPRTPPASARTSPSTASTRLGPRLAVGVELAGDAVDQGRAHHRRIGDRAPPQRPAAGVRMPNPTATGSGECRFSRETALVTSLIIGAIWCR